ncbi:hypothetical protein Goarm_009907 [Gossypium armourianum]|uniref:Uncharacterized protein n=1 Tax=Gossypium armourianum TaxID=34283 RepID=A0A7J9JUF3_9ROSI|nr:hypothetical protein [Gossypium armourianum]
MVEMLSSMDSDSKDEKS